MFEIIETRVMRGPNQWSDYHTELIVLKIKITLEKEIDFLKELKNIFPDMQPANVGANDIAEGIKLIALELQKKAGMNVEYGNIHHKPEQQDIYRVVYSYEFEEAGKYAGTSAIEIAEDIINNREVDLEEYIEELKYLRKRNDLGATSAFLLQEGISRGIPYKRFDQGSLVTLGYGKKQQKMRTALVDSTSGIGIELAGDKEETKKMLEDAHLPVPSGVLVYDEEDLLESLEKLQYPLAIKPLDGNHGRGVTTNVNDREKAVFGLHHAQKISRAVIVEEFISGDDHRLLVINYKLVAVAKRTPAHVTGDGKSTIEQLIEEENKNPERGTASHHPLALIKVDDVTLKIFKDKSLTLDSVLAKDKVLYLKDTANISAGGTATDVTDLIHPENIFMAERIAKMFNLNICGIDILTTDISVPLTKKTGAIIEVNAGPGIRMHTHPNEGIARNVAKPIFDMLFPDNDFLIPIVAITGTNGKTTTSRLIAHIAKEAGLNAGFTTSDGIYINDHMIEEGDCTGFQSAQTVLFEPTIDMAVLECARGGIIRSGLAFDKCDISVITNITDDHLGTKDIDTLEELANVKRVIAKNTKKDGYAILNADDDLVYNMQNETDCKVALFSLDENSERIRSHWENGGLAAVVEDEYLIIYNGEWKTRVEKIANIPLTFQGHAEFMIKNVLAAVLAGMILTDFNLEIIRKALHSFVPSPEQTPGRLNLFKFKEFDLIVDYAHNKNGFSELKKFLDKNNAAEKTGIIAAVGDRRDEDIRNIGRYAAQMFDKIIIRMDKDLRGRPEKEHSQLLMEGIREVNKNIPVEIIPEEKEAIKYAIDHASHKSLILACADIVPDTLALVSEALGNNKL
jgi:cyanophycin synthetase